MFKKITLDNGLRVVLAPQKDSLAATVLVLVEAGSKYETKEINGLSHFLEHMCFKGTTKRPGTLQIAKELDSMGAQYNAFTGEEYTGYYAKVRKEHLSDALDIISDLYLNPTFPKEEIEKERGVIIEEINMYDDLPQRKVHEIFAELVYGDQPAGWSVAGEKDVIKKLNRDDFVKYRSEHYVASSTVVVVAGNFDEEKTVLDIKERFATMPDDPKSAKLAVKEEQDSPKLRIQNKKSDQTHMVVGVRAFPATDDRRFALEVLSDVLGGGMSSRLFEKVREELGAAYYIRSGADLSTDHGLLIVSSGVDHTKVHEVLKAILGEFKKLKDEPVDDEHLERSKEHIVGNLILSLETSDDLATFTGMQEVIKHDITNIDDIIKKVKAITAEDIQNVANEIFDDKKLNMAIIGPFSEKENSEEFVKELTI